MRRTAALRALMLLAAMLVASAGRASDELYQLTAKAAILVDAQTGSIYFARNATTPLPPASTTKIVTALIALRETAPDELMRVSAQAAAMPASKAYLRTGSIYTSRDLLYALMLRSANDASVVIAEHIGGSVPGFARMMNETARAAGATDSNFITPNGLPMPGHVTTARDLALIFRQALRQPGLRNVLSTRTQTIEPVSGGPRRIALRSTNKMLWRDDLTVIGKTGWTREAKRCFVGAASYQGREVILAVLGSRDLWGDVELLARTGLGHAVPGYDDTWRQRAGLQQAAIEAPAAAAPAVTWRRGGSQAEMQRVAPPPSARSERTARLATTSAKLTATQRARNAQRAALEAQGDREDPRRTQLRYHLEFGGYRSKTRAQQVGRDLAKRGYRAEVQAKGGAYRVVVRNFSSRDAARKAARTIGRTYKVEPIITASK
ncbi:MAG: D-alanyl-D-alanine carboxypeptidase [Deltaproteobacteria bacterium]|nr:D-alanyl-D-alanine carboxypeptidase [Deltaproteobacteria bacterium]